MFDLPNRTDRAGLSIIEILVVVSIVGLLLALVLPAVQAARESSRRSHCANNLRQVGIGMLHFEQTNGRLPSGGEGADYSVNPPATVFELQSTFTQVVPYLEEAYLAAQINPDLAYNDAAWPDNQVAAKTVIPTFLCPSSAVRSADPNGYGTTDYMPTVYTDIDPLTGTRNPLKRARGALQLGGTPVAKIVDGLSRTIAIAEDAGRGWQGGAPAVSMLPPDPVFSGGVAPIWNGSRLVAYAQWCADHKLVSGGVPLGESPAPGAHRIISRWAEPASAGGVSGQANSTAADLLPPINGNALPLGGPATCPWSRLNCGPNEEIFSGHPQGANVLMCDGSVTLIRQQIDPRVLRRLVTAEERLPYDDADLPQ
ncbi:MAG TPA: DUF1559 domain-containing protein [Pirellulales bacterium]